MKKIPLPPKSVIVSGLVAGIVGLVLFAALLILNWNNDNTLLLTGLIFFLLMHAFCVALAIYRLKNSAIKSIKPGCTRYDTAWGSSIF